MKICPLCRSEEFESLATNILCDAKNSKNRCSPCQSLVELDKKIEEARQNLIDLAATRQRLLVDVNREHDTLTTHLPLELCSKIFELCNSDCDTSVSFPRPMPLTQVCRNWRTISHSTPGLWTSLRFTRPPEEGKWSNWKEFAFSWLRRCGDFLPLSISIHSDFEIDPQGDYCITVCEIFRRFSHRLKRLDVDVPATFSLKLRSSFKGEVTLASLRFRSRGKSVNVDYGRFVPKKLYLDGSTLQGAGVDARKLTHAEVGYISIDECVNLFTLATQMVSCILVKLSWPGDVRQSFHPFVRQALKELSIEADKGSTWESTVYILDMMNLPSLERLSVGMPSFSGSKIIEALIDHVHRSDSHLTTLSISNLYQRDLEASSFNSLMRTVGHSLRHLYLIPFGGVGDGTLLAAMVNTSLNDLASLQSLTWGSSEGSWIQNLQKIVSVGSTMVAARPQKFLVTLRASYWQFPLDPETGSIVLNCNPASDIEPTVTEAIISAMKNPFLSVKVEVSGAYYNGRTDITNGVVDALTRFTDKN